MSDNPAVKPVIIHTEDYAKSCRRRVWSDDHVDFVCTWPGCTFSADTTGSMGSHYKRHSGRAAQRRRGERPSLAGDLDDMVSTVFSVIDQLNTLVDRLAAIEADYAEAMEAKRKLRELRETLGD